MSLFAYINTVPREIPTNTLCFWCITTCLHKGKWIYQYYMKWYWGKGMSYLGRRLLLLYEVYPMLRALNWVIWYQLVPNIFKISVAKSGKIVHAWCSPTFSITLISKQILLLFFISILYNTGNGTPASFSYELPVFIGIHLLRNVALLSKLLLSLLMRISKIKS